MVAPQSDNWSEFVQNTHDVTYGIFPVVLITREDNLCFILKPTSDVGDRIGRVPVARHANFLRVRLTWTSQTGVKGQQSLTVDVSQGLKTRKWMNALLKLDEATSTTLSLFILIGRWSQAAVKGCPRLFEGRQKILIGVLQCFPRK